MGDVTLGILRCGQCGRAQLAPREHCRSCGSGALTPERIPAVGTIYSYTVIRVPPARFQQDAPYAVVAVRFAEDIMVTGRMSGGVEEDALWIGRRVRLLREDDAGYWFEPVG